MDKHGKWEFYDICSKCDETLSERTVYYGGGVCPHCGHNSGNTLCDYRKIVRRKLYTDTRKLAIQAQKLRKANVITRFLERFKKQPERPFIWEYKTEERSERGAIWD